MNTYNSETLLSLNLMSDLLKKPHIAPPPLQEVNLPKLLLLSVKNNIAYYASKNILDIYGQQLSNDTFGLLEKLVERGDKLINNLKHATSKLESCLKEYMIFKTYRSYPRIPNDIDILVRDLDKAVGHLRSVGMKLCEHTDLHAVVLISNRKIRLHLHDKISWAGSTYFDDKLIHENSRTVTLWGVKVKIPNLNADFLIHIAHINFEQLFFTVSDFLYLCKLAHMVDWNIILNEAKKHHWMGTFKRSISLLDSVYHTFYLDPCPFKRLNLEHQPRKGVNIKLPYLLPRDYIITAFFEKRLFMYLARKSLKSIYIMFTGDVYKPFYLPPEWTLIKKSGTVFRLDNSEKDRNLLIA